MILYIEYNSNLHPFWSFLEIFLSLSLGYSLITKHGICRHVHGENVICNKTSVKSQNSCEESCTTFEGCMGYSFSSRFGTCQLYPSDISDNQTSCPWDKGFVQQHGQRFFRDSYGNLRGTYVSKSMNEMVPFGGYNRFKSYYDYVCYKKNSGQTINSFL